MTRGRLGLDRVALRRKQLNTADVIETESLQPAFAAQDKQPNKAVDRSPSAGTARIERILAVIPHYFAAEPGAIYGSLAGDRAKRAAALRDTILALVHGFNWPNCVMNPVNHRATPANNALKRTIHIVICTIGDNHVLNDLDVPRDPAYFSQVSVDIEPRLLGFACRNLLARNLGTFDGYCFLEDDIIVRDPSFFDKTAWFSATFGNSALLQPNRYELRASAQFWKGYIDGDIRPETATRLQLKEGHPELSAPVFGRSLRFLRPSNPHSGCYFLNAAQMAHWAAQPWFSTIDTGFVDPMASAATLGILRAFTVYKPAMENASFLEVEHAHARYLQRVGRDVPIDEEAFGRA